MGHITYIIKRNCITSSIQVSLTNNNIYQPKCIQKLYIRVLERFLLVTSNRDGLGCGTLFRIHRAPQGLGARNTFFQELKIQVWGLVD